MDKEIPLHFLIKITDTWAVMDIRSFLHNSLYLSCDGHWQIASIIIRINEVWAVTDIGRLLIKSIEIWTVMDVGRFLYNSGSESLKSELRWTYTDAYTHPHQFNKIWAVVDICRFLYNSLSKSLKSELWWTWADSLTIPYQNHRNLSCDGHRQIPSQFLINIIETWAVMEISRFLHNSLSTSL